MFAFSFHSTAEKKVYMEAYQYVFDRAVAHIVEHGYQSPIDNEIMQLRGEGDFRQSNFEVAYNFSF